MLWTTASWRDPRTAPTNCECWGTPPHTPTLLWERLAGEILVSVELGELLRAGAPQTQQVSSLCSHELMCLCWQQNPRQRPSFIQLLERIKDHMAPAFRTLSFFYSSENGHHGSGEPSNTEIDPSPEEEEPPASPLPTRKDPSPGQLPNGTASL